MIETGETLWAWNITLVEETDPLILATNEGMNEQTNKHRHKLTNYTTIVNFKETVSQETAG